MAGLEKNFYKAAIKRAEALTLEETGRLLKEAGIIDDDGCLAERYRAPAEEQPQASSTAVGHD